MAMAQPQAKIQVGKWFDGSTITGHEWQRYGMYEGPDQVVERTRIIQIMASLRYVRVNPTELLSRAVRATVEEELATRGIELKVGDTETASPLVRYVLYGSTHECDELLARMGVNMNQFVSSLGRKLVQITSSQDWVPAELLR